MGVKRTMEYDMKKLVWRNISFFLMALIGMAVLVIATNIKIENLAPFTSSDITLNATLNSDCTRVVLSKVEYLPTNSNGQVFTSFDPNDMDEMPNYICKYSNGILIGVEDVTGYDFNEELIYRNQDLSVWSNKSGVVVGGVPVNVSFNRVPRKDFFFNFTANPNLGDNTVVNIRKGGNYFVSYDASLNVLSGNTSTSSSCWLIDGVDKILGTDSFGYHRSESAGFDTLSMSRIIQLDKSSMVRLQCKSLGANTLTLVPGGSRLTIQYARKKM
jgi:hypothetical protein